MDLSQLQQPPGMVFPIVYACYQHLFMQPTTPIIVGMYHLTYTYNLDVIPTSSVQDKEINQQVV